MVADNYEAVDGCHPMPWTWELCLYCMNMQTGSFIHWPLAGGLRKNQPILQLMRLTWRTWQWLHKVDNDKYEWTEHDLEFHIWLTEGRERPQPLSNFEKWANERARTET